MSSYTSSPPLFFRVNRILVPSLENIGNISGTGVEVTWVSRAVCVSRSRMSPEPVWSATRSELFFRHEEEVLAVDVVTNPTFEHGRPRKLFEGRYALGDVKDDTRAYDVAPDGQRFLMLRPEPEPSTDLKVVVNWYDELQRLGHTRE